MRRFLVIGLVMVMPALAAGQSRLLRHPTYSKGRVAFSYLGDIWMAREDGSGVQRLTVHNARDVYPRFSPDGQWIAFSSNREGNYDVYVMPAAGGKARQLTFHSADDMVVGWSADGARVMFQSTRAAGVFPSVATLWEVAADGGTERAIATDWGSWGSYSPDGSKLAFTRHPGVWSRKHYRGSYAVDLWLMDVAARKFTKLGNDEYKGNYLWPMYGANGEIYFVADRLPDERGIRPGSPQVMQSVNNIWKISQGGGAPVRVTRHVDGNLFFPSISADGKTIVYEEGFGLWKLDVASGQSSEIRIDIRSDLKSNEVELRAIQSEAEAFSLSPSNKRAAISTHGEIFTVATDRGDVQRVTETSWREQEPRWSPSGKWIAFISDRSGREQIWIADERGKSVRQLSDADCDKGSIVWAPDSKSLLWAGSDHKLRKVEIESGNTEVVASSDAGPIGLPQYSPDGKWISYSKPDGMLRSHVYVKQLDGGVEKMIGSEQFLVSSSARWTSDGKKLVMLAGIGAPAMASLNRSTIQLYSVTLAKIEKRADEADVDLEEQAEGETGRRFPTSRSVRGEVKIDWDGLERRVRQLTRMSGSVTTVVPSPDGRTYAFVAMGGEEEGAGPGLYVIAEDGSRLTRIGTAPAETTEGSPRGRGFGFGGYRDLQWSKDGRSIYYLQGGGIYVVGVPGGGGAEPASTGTGGRFGRVMRGMGAATPAPAEATSSGARRITFTARMQVDAAAERLQVFEESWRVMKDRFYDRAMHGVDWAAAKERYKPLLADVADSDELHNVIMQMIGELNASHTGISGGDTSAQAGERVQTRFPGFELEAGESGCYKVAYIYKKGPADHDYVKLQVGNYILAVNGKALKTSDNYWRFFNLVPGRKFEFTVNAKPQMDGAWTVSLEPLSGAAQATLEYERWVEGRKAMVDKLSDGQIGYLHIKAMDAPSLAKFQRDLLTNQSKKALIIDQRFNGGGGIDQELLQILGQRKAYQSTRGRDSLAFPRPIQAFFGPMVVLQNERSASNAEMFPDGFRALGLGKVIGVPTYGAVIGTGSYRLLDGSSIRTPGFGVYTSKGENMENYGVPPDIHVDNTPADFLAGRDAQIEKAVEVLRGEVK